MKENSISGKYIKRFKKRENENIQINQKVLISRKDIVRKALSGIFLDKESLLSNLMTIHI